MPGAETRLPRKYMSHKLWLLSEPILEMCNINPYCAGTELSRLNLVNVMAADALAPYVARASAAMLLTV